MDLFSILSTSFLGHGLALGDFFWDHPMFKKDQWEPLSRFIHLALALCGALFLIYEARARKLGEPLRQRTTRRITIFLTVVAFFTYYDFFNPHTRYSEYYHRHEFYHYYLGSKFSDEVGYTRLYECTLIAEVENGREADVRKRELRDLRVNLIKPVTDSYVFSDPGQCKNHFTPERWAAFKKDINWFYQSAKGSYWENMQKDHGYNPPPVWTMAGKFFANFGSASDSFFKLLASIDVILQGSALLLLGWAFGLRVMMVAAIFWAVNGAANFYWTGGAFLRQDWIFFMVASVCLARKRYFALAGAALTYSTLLRIFPVLAFVGWGIIIGIDVMRRIQKYRAGQPLPGRGISRWLHPHHQRLIAGCVVTAGILLPLSVVVTGPDSYRDFYNHTLRTHNETPLTNHMGLKSIMAHTWDGRMRFGRNDSLSDPFQEWKQGRIDRNHNQRFVRYAIIGFLGLWTIWALRRTKLLWVGPALSQPLLMCMTELTCYYYSCFMVAAVLIKMRPTFGPAFLTSSAASFIVLFSFYWVDDKFVSMSWVFLLLSLLILYVYSRPFSMERLKAWWANRPDPKPVDGKPVEISLTP